MNRLSVILSFFCSFFFSLSIFLAGFLNAIPVHQNMQNCFASFIVFGTLGFILGFFLDVYLLRGGGLIGSLTGRGISSGGLVSSLFSLMRK